MAQVTTLSPMKPEYMEDVQEVKNGVPQRYVRDVAERPAVDTTDTPVDIPVIDLSKLLKGDDEDQFNLEMSKLTVACQDWGFFQVINHGIDVETRSNMEKSAMDFFLQPLEEKQKYPMPEGIVQGYGQAFVFSEDEKLDWCNMLALAYEPHHMRILDLLPKNPPTFGEDFENYSREMKKLCKCLLSFIAISLGLNKDIFEDIFAGAIHSVRMNYYPVCPRPDLVMGLSPHSDGSGLTVLQQNKGSPVGLQILKDNTWVPVQPIADALIINIGDTLEVLTNGKYQSVEHRAVTHKEKDRMSIVTFYAPSCDTELGPLAEMMDENHPAKYRRYNHGEYTIHYISNKLQGKKTLEYAKIQPQT